MAIVPTIRPGGFMFFKILFFPFRLIRSIFGMLSGLYYFLFTLFILSLIFVLAVVGIGVGTFNVWAPWATKTYIQKKADFPTQIQTSNCSLKNGIVDFEGVTLENPTSKFTQKNCITFNKVSAEVNWSSLFQNEIVIPEVVIDIDRITCEKNKAGEMNLMLLADALMQKTPENLAVVNPPSTKKMSQNQKDTEKQGKNLHEGKLVVGEKYRKVRDFVSIKEGKHFVVRKLTLRVGTCELYNVLVEGEARKLKINKTLQFEDVRSKKDIVAAILADPDLQAYGVTLVVQVALGSILNFPGVNAVQQTVKGVHKAGKEMVNEAASFVQGILPSKEALKSIPDQLKEGLKAAANRDNYSSQESAIKGKLRSRIEDDEDSDDEDDAARVASFVQNFFPSACEGQSGSDDEDERSISRSSGRSDGLGTRKGIQQRTDSQQHSRSGDRERSASRSRNRSSRQTQQGNTRSSRRNQSSDDDAVRASEAVSGIFRAFSGLMKDED